VVVINFKMACIRIRAKDAAPAEPCNAMSLSWGTHRSRMRIRAARRNWPMKIT